ncbi:MAG: BolA family transcriptional regulator [Xanthomonadales bacterium]|nr:BolA family transcriptional regulator [Xanthomonadales bacterium]
MNTEERIQQIRRRLDVTLQPQALEVIDEGHLHRGHEGAKDGRGHFRLKIVSRRFIGQSMVQRHRLVYQAMGDLMQSDIHALAIDALAPVDS